MVNRGEMLPFLYGVGLYLLAYSLCEQRSDMFCLLSTSIRLCIKVVVEAGYDVCYVKQTMCKQITGGKVQLVGPYHPLILSL